MSAVRRDSDRARGPYVPCCAPRRVNLGLACFALAVVLARGSSAEPPADPAAEVAAHVESGQFESALEHALRARDADRDRLLATVAVALAKAGDRGQFADTLDKIGDERVRMQAARDGRFEILAQFVPPQPPAGNQFPPLGGPQPNAGQQPGNLFGQVGAPGGNEADFTELMELITSTIQPESWVDVGGPGALRPFPSGVLVDAAGLMRRLADREMSDSARPSDDALLTEARKHAAPPAAIEIGSPRRMSPLRMVSLPRLERHLLRELAAGRQLDETVTALAGLARVQYVFILPEARDIVLAGPAGDWRHDAAGRLVSTDAGRPILRLDDFVTVLRLVVGGDGGAFGCSIVPRQAGLAAAQEFALESARAPLKPDQRGQWLETLRTRLGRQDIEFYGIAPDSHAARVLIEADYHMKLIGAGLAEGTPAVPSYLELVERAGAPPESLDVLRWWFTLKYEALLASADRLSYGLRGPAVQVLSESELLARDGRRIHTGESEPRNREFAAGFTADFASLASRYPVYGELANIFDLAVAAALIRQAAAPDKIDWQLGCLADEDLLRIPRTFVPREVDTVANSFVMNKRQIVAMVSGGVRVDPEGLISELGFRDDQGQMQTARAAAVNGDERVWWWDADPAPRTTGD